MPYNSAKKGNKKTVVYSGDSNVLIRKNGTIAWRNNNPGNMKCNQGSFAKRHGAIGCDGTFAIFPDTETGRKAQVALLKIQKYQEKSIREVIKAYSPDGNETNYIKYVTSNTGLSGDSKLSEMKPQEFSNLIHVMRKFEDSRAGTEVVMPASKNAPGEDAPNRTLRRVGDTVYRIENGRSKGSFICNGKKK
ncbi:MAG: hypothetical protein HZB82_05360 [Deltaproteobacteria bacterium]|nr:hypothetical protein [Deltaproteobacteria bacterium]